MSLTSNETPTPTAATTSTPTPTTTTTTTTTPSALPLPIYAIGVITSYAMKPFPPAPPIDRFWPSMKTHAIEPSCPFIPLWESEFRAATMAFVRETLPNGWCAVNVLRRGYSQVPEECEPCVMIELRPGTVVNGRMIEGLDALWRRFGGAEAEAGFNMEIR